MPEPIPYPEGKKLATPPATTPEQASASQRKAGVATLFGSRIASAARPRRAPFARYRETAAVNRETSARTVASSLTGRSSAPARRGVAGQRAENRPASKLGSGQDFAKRTAPTTAARISNEPLALLAVRLPAFPQDEPEVRAKRRPRARPSRRELLLRGWSAQLLAGTGLTYRAVGSGATQLEQLERPSMGFSAQASGAYALTRQLTVSAGLGYAEYATALRYQLSKSGQDSAVSRAIKFRDVYRFITVPLQVQYTLQGNHRWRVGVLGGGTMALLTGARTTEGTACNCSQRQWQPGVGITNPFARTSLLLNAGVFANYQFAPGQWLTIRPQGQLFLNSLTEQASGRAARRPWSLGIQAGYSWDLDPRKR
ncbi:PorT family protein [Hymenobacter sp. 5516J-16]|uniref:PorT family protein n=1 Tax=Hymenobacter sp. 5516J-16 TaxID=2932253 RepID=UPI001FD1DC65|nr:PorT family protein [Hymenobacter sp. 5516J-16]UOQ76709.1 PorT family protein [Hymenobacter sp. 5516J-16]